MNLLLLGIRPVTVPIRTARHGTQVLSGLEERKLPGTLVMLTSPASAQSDWLVRDFGENVNCHEITMRLHPIGFTLLVLLSLATGLHGQQAPPMPSPEHTLTVSWKLRSIDSIPQAAKSITFALYDTVDAVTPLWQETKSVVPDAYGRFTTLLGTSTTDGIPADVFSEATPRWIGVRVDGQAEEPRALLAVVAYAVRAGEALRLGGKSQSDFLLRDEFKAEVQDTVRQELNSMVVGQTVPLFTVAPHAAVVQAETLTPSPSVQQFDSVEVSETGYIGSTGIVDDAVRLIPKLFLASPGSPTDGGVIPSLTFRSTNPSHIFGEVAFQDNTTSPGQDIWAMQQDAGFTHTESLTFRRRGQPVLTFTPLGVQGSNVLATWSGTKTRFERSGPYPVEYRDLSLQPSDGLWRTVISGDCWWLDKNLSLSGDFTSRMSLIEACASTGVLTLPSVKLNPMKGIAAGTDLPISAAGAIRITSTGSNGNISFTPGAGGSSLFSSRVGIGTTSPQGSLHIVSGGNLQDLILQTNNATNHGLSIRNAQQNWAMGVRADRSNSWNLRNITQGLDAMLVSTSGDLSTAGGISANRSIEVRNGATTFSWTTTSNGNLSLLTSNGVSAISVEPSGRVSIAGLNTGTGTPIMQKSRLPISLEGNTTSKISVTWPQAFPDSNYVATCTAQTSDDDALGLQVLRTTNLTQANVDVLITNGNAGARAGFVNCIAID